MPKGAYRALAYYCSYARTAKVTSGFKHLRRERVFSALKRKPRENVWKKRFMRYDNVYARIRLPGRFLKFPPCAAAAKWVRVLCIIKRAYVTAAAPALLLRRSFIHLTKLRLFLRFYSSGQVHEELVSASGGFLNLRRHAVSHSRSRVQDYHSEFKIKDLHIVSTTFPNSPWIIGRRNYLFYGFYYRKIIQFFSKIYLDKKRMKNYVWPYEIKVPSLWKFARSIDAKWYGRDAWRSRR